MSDESKHKQGDGTAAKPIDLEAGRRAFIKAAGLGGAFVALTGAMSGAASAQTADLDVAILNFALNLEYLEAEFYMNAVYGTGLPENLTTGVGARAPVKGGGTKVPFQNPVVADYAAEIAADERNHVQFLRANLGSAAVARPPIDIGATFSIAARAAGVIGPTDVFDAYANDVNFLLAAYIFEDVGVTAYSGAAPFITNKSYLAAAAGILSVEAYHAGLIRAFLFAQQNTTVTTATAQISKLRATLAGANDDQGIGADQSTLAGGAMTPSNIVPTDSSSLAYARTPRQVLNIVYGNANASNGLFFPDGVNGGPGGAALLQAT